MIKLRAVHKNPRVSKVCERETCTYLREDPSCTATDLVASHTSSGNEYQFIGFEIERF